MPLTIAICDDNENQIKEMRRLLAEWSADKPFALDIDEYISAESFLFHIPTSLATLSCWILKWIGSMVWSLPSTFVPMGICSR